MKKQIFTLSALALLSFVFFPSCEKDEETQPPATNTGPTLYERVGGTALVNDPKNPGTMIETGRLTLRSVVDSAILVIAADPQMTPFFPVLLEEVGEGETTGLSALSLNLTDFMAMATGSKTAVYGGKNMKNAHNPATNPRMGAKVSAADFDRFVADVSIALGKNGVTDQQLISDLVALLNTTKGDIVQN